MARGTMSDHGGLMLVMPILPLLLLGTIAMVTTASHHGLLGDDHREVDIALPLVVVAAALSVGAAGIHFAVIQEHLEEEVAAAAFFLVLAWFQVIWAMAFLLRPVDLLRVVGIVVNSAVVVIWIVSRSVGLPFGLTPWHPEEVGLADLFAMSFEVVLVGLLAAALLPRLAKHVSGYNLTIEKAYVLASFSVITVGLLTGMALLGMPPS